jgi:hypothetical protein
MPLPVERLLTTTLAQLTDRETQSCVVYLATARVARGEQLSLPRLTFACPRDGYLTFVDLDPMANWGHACCYLCIEPQTGEVHRIDAQFPPFGPPKADRPPRQWEVIYRAPGVPEALLTIPEQ